MSLTLSPNMFLTIPGVGTEQGPDYAIDVNNCLSIIDQHDHTPGSGVQITPAAININADLTMATNNLTDIKMLQMSPQGAQTAVLSIYVAPGGESPSINDLWYNDSNGTAVQLTKQGLVNATLASIPGESYSAGTFTWVQGALSTTPANFDIGYITLRPNIAATTYGTRIRPNPSLASSWILTLPNNPSGLASNSFLTLDASGNMTTGPTVNAGLTTTNLSPTAGILGSQLASNANIVGTQLSASANIASTQLAVTGVTAGSYVSPNITVNAEGQITSATAGTLATSGTYTPTVSNAVGCSGFTPGVFQYMRVGSVITASGNIFFGGMPGTPNFAQFEITVPVASNFTLQSQAAGFAGAAGDFVARIEAVPSSQRVQIQTTPTTTNAVALAAIHFTYQII